MPSPAQDLQCSVLGNREVLTQHTADLQKQTCINNPLIRIYEDK